MVFRQLLITVIVLLSLQLQAQDKYGRLPSDDELATYPYWIEMMQDPHANFFDTQYAFEVYWKDRKARKGAGWKPFKRWENFMSTRVSEIGVKPAAQDIWNAIQYDMAMQSSASSSGDWTELGPISLPANGTGQPNGLGRVNCIAFHPTNADTIFIGAPAGGIWKTYDGGTTWSSNSDNLSTLGISSILVHPNSTDTMYVGTGDRDGGDAIGLGVLLSVDGGNSWVSSNTGMGNATVGAMLIDPADNSILLAATNLGIFRSTNGGASWSSVASGNYKDIRFMPGNSAVVYATKSGDFYRSSNNGLTWSVIGSGAGLPSSNRLVIGVTPADSSYVYAVLTAGDNTFQGMYLSVDSGLTFTEKSTTPNIMDYSSDGSGTSGQAWYDLCVAVSPTNENEVYVGGVNVFKSTDSGASWTINAHWVGTGAPAVHADHHTLEYSPVDGTLYSGNDGGLYYQAASTSTWTDISSGLAIAQCYKLGQSATSLNHVIVGYQDNGTAVYSNGSWSTEIGGDGMECIIDYTTTNYMYGALYYGAIRRSSNGGINFSSIAGNGVNGITESGGWVTPYTLHTTNPNTMFIGYKDIWRSTNVKASSSSSVSWTEISTSLGGTGNFNVVEHSALDTNVFYASKGASIFRSDDVNAGTVTWQTLTAPGGSTIKDILCHPTDTNTVYIAQGTKIYESIDKGVTWIDITGNINNSTIKNCLVYSPVSGSEGLYVGSDYGVYFKPNNSSNWNSYSNGLPVYPKVTELELFINDLSPAQNSLRASSYGRGLWTTSIYVDPNTPIVADFYSSDSISCLGTVVNLIDGTSGVPTSWSWTITPSTFSYVGGTDSTSQFPEVNFSSVGSYSVSLIVSNSTLSDTVTKPNYIEITGGEQLFLELLTDNFASETSWILSDTNGTEVLSGSGYENNSLNLVTMDCLVDSCYTFTIYDSYGDGICCSWGSGNYIITNSAGDTMASGGVFTNSQVSSICFTPVVPSLDCDAAIDLTCGEIYAGTTLLADTSISNYSCSSEDESGPEVLHRFVLTDSADIEIELNTLLDLNIYLLDSCHQESCIAFGDSTISFDDAAPGEYFIVVDGTTGAAGAYTLHYYQDVNATISVSNSQICVGDSVQLNASGANDFAWSPAIGLSDTIGNAVYAFPTVTTTYYLTGSSNGCSSTDTITIIIENLPDLTISTDVDSLCQGDTTQIDLDGALVYSWFPSAGLSSDTGATVLASPSITTTYYITATSGVCSVSDSITIFVKNIPIVEISSTDTILCSGESVLLLVEGAIDYLWSPSVGLNTTTGDSILASPTSTTLYTVIGSSNGCYDTDSILVIVNTIPDIIVETNMDSLCTGDVALLTSTGATTYSWSPSNGLNATSGDSVQANPIITTTYIVTGEIDGCSSSDSVTIVVNEFPSISISTTDSVVCLGDSTTISALGADNYNWSPSAGLNMVNGATIVASPIVTTTYLLTAESNGCIGYDSITVIVNTIPDILVLADTTDLCEGDFTALTALGADSYFWSPSTGLNLVTGDSVIASPLVTTTYVVTGLSNGCVAMDSITLVVHPVPLMAIETEDTIICQGDSVELSVIGANSYTWSPSVGLNQITGSTIIANPAVTTTYIVEGITNGCVVIDSVVISVVTDPLLVMSTDTAFICLGDTAFLSASGANAFNWSPSTGLNTSSGAVVMASPSTSMMYSVEGVVNNCISFDSIFVMVKTPPTVTANLFSDTICVGDAISIVVSGADNYTWTPSVGLNVDTGAVVIASPSVSTNYVVTGYLNGCFSSDTVFIEMIQPPVLSFSFSDSLICYGDSVLLSASGADTYIWNPSSSLNQSVGSSVMAIPTVSTTYYVEGIQNGCSVFDSVVIGVVPEIVVAISLDSAFNCAGDSILLSVTGADSYHWIPNTGLNIDTGSVVYASPQVSTNYIVEGLVNGCISYDTVFVEVILLDSLSFLVDNSILCPGDSTSITVYGADSYQWEPAIGLSVDQGAIVQASPNNSTTYYVTGEVNGCQVLDSISILVNPVSNLILDQSDSIICSGDSVSLYAQGADNITWYFESDTLYGDTVYVAPEITTEFQVHGYLDGCRIVDSLLVSVEVMPTLSVGLNNTSICLGDTGLITVSGANGYSWTLLDGTNVGTGDSIYLSPAISTEYIVIGTSEYCQVADTVLLEVIPLPEFEILTDVNVIYLLGDNNTVEFESTGDGSLFNSWFFGDGDSSDVMNPSHAYYIEGLYTVVLEAMDSNNCSSMDSVLIEVLNNISVEEIEGLDWLDIFPNPTEGIIHIMLDESPLVIDEIRIFDASGRQVLVEKHSISASIDLDISNQQDGHYIIALKVGESVYTKIIQKQTK